MKKHPLALLTMGRSLIRLKDRNGVYKLPTGKMFPEFGASGRRKGVLPAAVRAPAPATQANLFEAPKEAVAAVAPPMPLVNPAVAAPRPSTPPKAVAAKVPSGPSYISRAASTIGRWWEKILKTIAWPKWGLRVPRVFQFGAPSVAQDSRPRAQTELALQQVTVLRNDLSEADLTVVKVAAKKPAAPDAGAGTGGNTAWTRATARWIKGKSPRKDDGTLPEGPGPLPELQP
jgi:hypothetical protein